ncbi:MAG: FAD-dependent oxidoreductase [Bacteroidales bacterium]|nr:FAD-dependent oxidoreductase [Bacteroidales bacterium]
MLAACKPKYDVCIYGGSAAGIVAAYSAAQMGLNVVVIEPTARFGGLTTGGLGQTDIGNKQVVKGLALQFYRKLGAHYGNLENWVFEPSAAAEIMNEYLSHPRITAINGYHLVDACKEGTDIRSIRVACDKDTLSFMAPWFIDCSYEGDLMAASGVEYRVGREDNSEYGETWNGVHMRHLHQFPDGVDPFVIPGDPESGLLWGISDQKLKPQGTGDSLVQAYNFRICLTDSLENMIPIEKPDAYDPSRYELLIRLYDAQPDQRDINQYFIWSPMPGRKTDVNNRSAFSTDMIGMNYDYPEGTWEQRQEIIKAHKDYTLGLLYFTAHDERIPAVIREFVAKWGLPKDEYIETGHWTPQLYVRESRRMVGEYVATQADCENARVAPDGIAMAAYTMDSHNCQRIVVVNDGKYMVKNEGDVEIYGGLPYPISYRSLTPKREQCTNLLVPVCCSASHIAYGSIRMEPVFMGMGQAAGLAVAFAKYKGLSRIQDVDYRDIVHILETDPFQNGTYPDIIMDDASIEPVPGWEKVAMDGSYGPSCFTGEPGCTPIVFSSVIPVDGDYMVYSYQHKLQEGVNPLTSIELSTGEKFEVHASDVQIAGQTTSAWHLLCNVKLKAGEIFSASFSSDGGDGKVVADAVLLVKNN